MSRGFYEQLGVDPRAATDELRRAYARSVAENRRRRKSVVDQGGDPTALDDDRTRLDEAFEVLADPVRRRRYDAMLALQRGDPPTDGEELWTRTQGALVPPAAGAAAELLRVSTGLAVGALPQPPRPAAPDAPRAAVFGEEVEATDALTHPTAVPVEDREPTAPVVRLPTAAAEPPIPPSADRQSTLRVVDGKPASAGVIVLPSRPPAPEPATLDVPAMVERHGWSGGLLAAVRKSKGMSLQELADSSRISVRYLEAIEADAYDRLPSATFVRGYVREMARLLELDESAVVTGFMRRFSGEAYVPVHEVEAAEAGRLDAVVAAAIPDLSRSRVAALIGEGAVTVDGVLAARPALKVRRGARIVVDEPEPEPDVAIPEDLPLRIVYEDASIVVVDKDAGMVVHPAAGHATGTLVNALLHHVGDLSGIGGVLRPGIVHRLDRGTSGLIVAAKTDRAHASLSVQFADHSAGRQYVALCLGVPDASAGTIRSELGRHPTDRLRFATVDRGGKPAVTHWTRLGATDDLSIIGCRLETGRTHQIRVHLCEAGWPLVGDPLYKRRGKRVPDRLTAWVAENPDRPLLHAWALSLTHPETGERLTWNAPVPLDFDQALVCAGIPANALPRGAQGS